MMSLAVQPYLIGQVHYCSSWDGSLQVQPHEGGLKTPACREEIRLHQRCISSWNIVHRLRGKEEWALTSSFMLQRPRIISAGGYDEMTDDKFFPSQQHLLKRARNGRSLRG
jgi:hypothetical protein